MNNNQYSTTLHSLKLSCLLQTNVECLYLLDFSLFLAEIILEIAIIKFQINLINTFSRYSVGYTLCKIKEY